MIGIYIFIVVLTFLFFSFYLGFYLPDRKKTIIIMRKRLSQYNGGKYRYDIASMPDDIIYNHTIWMVILISIFWWIELGAYLWILIKRIF